MNNEKKPVDNETSINRLNCLDGLRGWAALVVVFGHLTRDYPPFKYLLVSPLTDTRLAVGIFFIISGFVLSYQYIGKRIKLLPLFKLLIARYVRLVIPIATVSLLVLIFGFYCSGLHHILASQLEPQWGFGTFYNFTPSFADALKFASWDIFVNYNNNHTYIPPAWTMPRELLGSYFIYATVFIVGLRQYGNKRRVFAMIIAVFAFLALYRHFHYAAFFLYGYLLAEIYKDSIALTHARPNTPLALPTFIALMIYASFHSEERSTLLPLVAMSLAVVGSVLYSHRLSHFFANRFSLFLGKISFPLYLIHVPIYCCFSSWAIIWLHNMGFSQAQTYGLVFISSVPLAILGGYLLYPVELFAIKMSRKVNHFSIQACLNVWALRYGRLKKAST